jgi:hypothetical protein
MRRIYEGTALPQTIEHQIWKHNADVLTRILSSKSTAAMAGLKTCTTQDLDTNTKRRKHINSWQKIYDDMKHRRKQGFGSSVPTYQTDPRCAHGTKHNLNSTVYAVGLQGISLALQTAQGYVGQRRRGRKASCSQEEL